MCAGLKKSRAESEQVTRLLISGSKVRVLVRPLIQPTTSMDGWALVFPERPPREDHGKPIPRPSTRDRHLNQAMSYSRSRPGRGRACRGNSEACPTGGTLT